VSSSDPKENPGEAGRGFHIARREMPRLSPQRQNNAKRIMIGRGMPRSQSSAPFPRPIVASMGMNKRLVNVTPTTEFHWVKSGGLDSAGDS
jgi:hypothetical protein